MNLAFRNLPARAVGRDDRAVFEAHVFAGGIVRDFQLGEFLLAVVAQDQDPVLDTEHARMLVLHVVGPAAFQDPDVRLDFLRTCAGEEFAAARDGSGRHRQHRGLAHVELDPFKGFLQLLVLRRGELDHLEFELARSCQHARLPVEYLSVTDAFIVDRGSSGKRKGRLKAGRQADRHFFAQPAGDERAHRILPAFEAGPAQDVVDDPKALPDPGDVYDRFAAANRRHAVRGERDRGMDRNGAVEHVFGLELQRLQR